VMMGNLLRDRFHLCFHIESKIVLVSALRVAKKGPKFKETDPACRGDAKTPSGGGGAGSRSRRLTSKAYSAGPRRTSRDRLRAGRGGGSSTRPDLVAITTFKIHYAWTRRPTGRRSRLRSRPSIFTAVQEQLGLKLESASPSPDQLIMGSIDREPTEN
jgi:uncharacterized protein (TIGR03435 family)